MNISNLSPEEKMELLKLLSIKSDYEKYNKLEYFIPYKWQLDKLFPTGIAESVRGLLAGNQLGKLYGATFELACHITGKYPEWWNGHTFDSPIDSLVLGYDYSQMAKPNCILELIFGKPEDFGSGFIPKKDIIKLEMKTGYKGVVGKATIQHYNSKKEKDGTSTITIGAYSAGFENFMGSQFKFIYIDEQPRDKNILPQCIKRQAIFNGEGKLLATFTPEFGRSETTDSFTEENGIYKSGHINVTRFDLEGEWYGGVLQTHETIMKFVNSIPPWQREFSIYGRPSAGSGAVFAGIDKLTLVMPEMRLQSHWKRLAAIDFGMRDTNVVTFGAYDEETQTYYVYDELLHTNTDAAIIALLVKTKQSGYIPMIYPADGDAERGVGTTYAQIYKNAGCILTNEQARNWELDKEGKDRTIGPGIAFIRQLMLEGRLKISPTCTGFLKEMDQYSYDDKGKFIDKNNHSVDSVRYLIMGIRKFGKVKQAQQKPNRKQEYIEF